MNVIESTSYGVNIWKLITPEVLTAYLISSLTCQKSTNTPQMTPFCKEDIPRYLERGIVSFLKLSFFPHNSLQNQDFFSHNCHISRLFLTHSICIPQITPQNTFCYSSRVWWYHMCETFTQRGQHAGSTIRRSGTPRPILTFLSYMEKSSFIC